MFKLISLLVVIFLFSQVSGADDASVWMNESEVAVVKTSGNSETESYSVKQSSSKKVDVNTYSVKGSYLKTASENATGSKNETARKWDLGTRYERSLSEKWSGFVGYKIESDKYAGYQQRHNTDLGAKYIIYQNEKMTWIGEGGYRYLHENQVAGTQTHGNGARAYTEYIYKFNDTNSAKAAVEYVPSFEESKDYQVNTELSITSVLSTMFSLKVAYETKTDNLPVTGADKTDTKLTTALVAKF
jgi:putative salt-induced outer membrane protein